MRSRRRFAAVAALAVVAASSLTACRTNVGYAATIDGTRYSESDISDYLTPDAEPVARQGNDGSQEQAPIRSFVVETLIGEKLLAKVADRLPGGGPTPQLLNQLRVSILRGGTVTKTLADAGIRGYSSSFNNLLLRRVTLSQYLDAASRQGVDIQAEVRSVPFSVSLNPRYGEWDAKNRSFDGTNGSGAPAFLSLRPQASTPSAPATTGP